METTRARASSTSTRYRDEDYHLALVASLLAPYTGTLVDMSVRYSGDTEIRLRHIRRRNAAACYEGAVVDPYLRFRGWVPVAQKFARDPKCPEAYDDAAKRLAALAERWAKSEDRRFMVEFAHDGRGIRIRRGFQAPCPLEDL